jgi:hypothetical protein
VGGPFVRGGGAELSPRAVAVTLPPQGLKNVARTAKRLGVSLESGAGVKAKGK